MPNINTAFGPGGVANTTLDREGVDIGARPDFWGDLDKMSRVFRPARTTPMAQGMALAMAPRGSSGTGPVRRKFDSGGGDAPPVTEGSHSFVQNMWGPQQTGGYVATSFGPRAVYGGWDPTGGMKGGVAVNPNVPEYRRQFEDMGPGEDPTARSFAMNAALGPSLADMQRSSRVSAAARPQAPGPSAEEKRRSPAKSYAGRR